MFRAQEDDTPVMLEEYVKLCNDALNYYKGRKERALELMNSGVEGGLLDRELEALDNKISFYVIRIRDVDQFLKEHVFNQDLFTKNKYPWVSL